MNFSKHWAATLDDYVIDLAWSPDGATLATASAAGGITLFDATGGTVRHTLPGHQDGTNVLAWSPSLAGPDGSGAESLLASGGQDGAVRFWNPASGRQVAETKLGGAWVEHLAWAGHVVPGTTHLFAAAGKKLAALRTDGAVAHVFSDAPKTITALAAGPGTKIPASAPGIAVAYFGGVAVWDAATFAVQKEFPYGNAIHALAWSPDGRWLVAGCQDNAVHLWVPTEDIELHMSGYETKLRELSFSRDARWLATGGGHDACVWDCAGAGPEGREPLLLPHGSRVIAVAFQNQHGLLATAGAGGEFNLWSPTRKNPLVAEVKMPAAATRFAWSPDDALLAVGTAKGAVYVFRVEG